ncbi:MAG: hypothetical protein IJV15_09520 [Lachnospiraceae bacterium]|nr:hypothetical protein [Lachnospiraceae bacterium]
MSDNKDFLKFVGQECLFLLKAVFIAVVTNLIQFIGRKYEGDYSSFMFAGSNYRYNLFFYILGHVLFFAFLIVAYGRFWKNMQEEIKNYNTLHIVGLCIIALVFAFGMLVALVFCNLALLGLVDNMKPEFLFDVTLFGFPIVTFAYMILIVIQPVIQMRKGN